MMMSHKSIVLKFIAIFSNWNFGSMKGIDGFEGFWKFIAILGMWIFKSLKGIDGFLKYIAFFGNWILSYFQGIGGILLFSKSILFGSSPKCLVVWFFSFFLKNLSTLVLLVFAIKDFDGLLLFFKSMEGIDGLGKLVAILGNWLFLFFYGIDGFLLFFKSILFGSSPKCLVVWFFSFFLKNLSTLVLLVFAIKDFDGFLKFNAILGIWILFINYGIDGLGLSWGMGYVLGVMSVSWMIFLWGWGLNWDVSCFMGDMSVSWVICLSVWSGLGFNYMFDNFGGVWVNLYGGMSVGGVKLESMCNLGGNLVNYSVMGAKCDKFDDWSMFGGLWEGKGWMSANFVNIFHKWAKTVNIEFWWWWGDNLGCFGELGTSNVKKFKKGAMNVKYEKICSFQVLGWCNGMSSLILIWLGLLFKDHGCRGDSSYSWDKGGGMVEVYKGYKGSEDSNCVMAVGYCFCVLIADGFGYFWWSLYVWVMGSSICYGQQDNIMSTDGCGFFFVCSGWSLGGFLMMSWDCFGGQDSWLSGVVWDYFSLWECSFFDVVWSCVMWIFLGMSLSFYGAADANFWTRFCVFLDLFCCCPVPTVCGIAIGYFWIFWWLLMEVLGCCWWQFIGGLVGLRWGCSVCSDSSRMAVWFEFWDSSSELLFAAVCCHFFPVSSQFFWYDYDVMSGVMSSVVSWMYSHSKKSSMAAVFFKILGLFLDSGMTAFLMVFGCCYLGNNWWLFAGYWSLLSGVFWSTFCGFLKNFCCCHGAAVTGCFSCGFYAVFWGCCVQFFWGFMSALWWLFTAILHGDSRHKDGGLEGCYGGCYGGCSVQPDSSMSCGLGAHGSQQLQLLFGCSLLQFFASVVLFFWFFFGGLWWFFSWLWWMFNTSMFSDMVVVFLKTQEGFFGGFWSKVWSLFLGWIAYSFGFLIANLYCYFWFLTMVWDWIWVWIGWHLFVIIYSL